MGRDGKGDVTQLLAEWAQGDRQALDSLMPIVYAELRKIAGGYLRQQRSGHTLQPTALVNEAWLRLVRQDVEDHGLQPLRDAVGAPRPKSAGLRQLCAKQVSDSLGVRRDVTIARPGTRPFLHLI